MTTVNVGASDSATASSGAAISHRYGAQSIPSRLTLMRDGDILDAPNVEARQIYERWSALLEDVRDASLETQRWLAPWMTKDGHPVQEMSELIDQLDT